jgi:hypothetical protein
LADYRAARRTWVAEALGVELEDLSEGIWQRIKTNDPMLPSPVLRLLRLVQERVRGREQIAERQRAGLDAKAVAA